MGPMEETTVMKTAHGVEMSPRMERLWTFIQSRRIQLHDWATDLDVLRELPELQVASAYLAEGGGKDTDPLTDREFEELRRDLAALMRRVPANRTEGATA